MRRSGFKGLVAAGVIATGMAASTSVVAASDIFLKITNLPGESQDDKHKNEIDVLSWSWGTSSGESVTNRGRVAEACIQDLALVKYVDSASPGLMFMSVLGQSAPDAVLTVRKSGGEQFEFLTLRMTNVSVASFQTGGSAGGSDVPTESITLNFDTIRFEYRRQKEDGSSAGPPIAYEVSGACK